MLKLGSFVSEIIRFIILIALTVGLSLLSRVSPGFGAIIIIPLEILMLVVISILTITVIISTFLTMHEGKAQLIVSMIILKATITMTVFNVLTAINIF